MAVVSYEREEYKWDYPKLKYIFPISNEIHLQFIEKKIELDEDFKSSLIDDLLNIKYGDTMYDLLKEIMKTLFCDVALAGYVYDRRGSNNDKNFVDLQLCNVVFVTILKHDKFENCYMDIEKKMKAYLSKIRFQFKNQNNE